MSISRILRLINETQTDNLVDPKRHTCQSPHNPSRKTKALPRVPHPRTIFDRLGKVTREIGYGCPARGLRTPTMTSGLKTMKEKEENT